MTRLVSRYTVFVFSFSLLLCVTSCFAQAITPTSAQDATWAKVYATDCGAAMKHPCPPSSSGYENEFNGDQRLLPLLKLSFPQHESWWVNGYGGSAPVSSIVQQFIGVPQALIVDDNRYVTASGCVPHDCGDGGMLWIDTGEQPATVVFIAHDSIEGFGDSGNHLWVYTSKQMNFGALPPELLASIIRWHAGVVAFWAQTNSHNKGIFSQDITVATLVHPNGRMQDLTYDMLLKKQNVQQSRKPGAKP